MWSTDTPHQVIEHDTHKQLQMGTSASFTHLTQRTAKQGKLTPPPTIFPSKDGIIEWLI
jgi:hypothetical protein